MMLFSFISSIKVVALCFLLCCNAIEILSVMTVFRFINLNGCVLLACLLLCTVFVRTLKLES